MYERNNVYNQKQYMPDPEEQNYDSAPQKNNHIVAGWG
jgi:hypothetical protein